VGRRPERASPSLAKRGQQLFRNRHPGAEVRVPNFGSAGRAGKPWPSPVSDSATSGGKSAGERSQLANQTRSTNDGMPTMLRFATKFYRDENGFVISSELVLVSTVGVIGLVAGLNAVTCAVVDEFNDVAGAMTALNQSYSTPTFTGSGIGRFGAKLKSFVAGSSFIDQRAQQTVVSGATMVGGPIVAPPVAIPAHVPQSAPCEAPAAVAPPFEVRQQAACVMCFVCCQPCVIGNCVPSNGVIQQPMPGVEHVPTPVPGTTPAQSRLESPSGSAPVK